MAVLVDPIFPGDGRRRPDQRRAGLFLPVSSGLKSKRYLSGCDAAAIDSELQVEHRVHFALIQECHAGRTGDLDRLCIPVEVEF